MNKKVFKQISYPLSFPRMELEFINSTESIREIGRCKVTIKHVLGILISVGANRIDKLKLTISDNKEASAPTWIIMKLLHNFSILTRLFVTLVFTIQRT